MEITVPVEDTSDVLTLKEYFGEGHYGDMLVRLCIATDGSPIIRVDGTTYTVSIRDVCKAVAKMHEALRADALQHRQQAQEA